MTGIRALLQPPDEAEALPRITVGLSVSIADSATCAHHDTITVTATPDGKVIVERLVGGFWEQIHHEGAREYSRGTGISHPSRTTGRYTRADVPYNFRARPALGFTGDAVYATVPIPTPLGIPGASLAGVAGFRVTRHGQGAAATCDLVVRPGGLAHEAYTTNFPSFEGACSLWLYGSRPTPQSGQPPPTPDHVVDDIQLELDTSAPTAFYKAFAVPVLDLGPQDWYAVVLARWRSTACSLAVDNSIRYPLAGGYPMILKVEI